MTEVCLEPIEKNRFKVVDCKTGEPASLDKTHSKRAPSAYNLFIKECLKKKTGPIQERFKECAKEYKKK